MNSPNPISSSCSDSIVLTIIEPKLRRIRPPMAMPPRMKPKRIVELFLGGAANPKLPPANGVRPKRASRLAKALAIMCPGLACRFWPQEWPDHERALHREQTNSFRPSPSLPRRPLTPGYQCHQPPRDHRRPGSCRRASDAPRRQGRAHPELATVSPIATKRTRSPCARFAGLFPTDRDPGRLVEDQHGGH